MTVAKYAVFWCFLIVTGCSSPADNAGAPASGGSTGCEKTCNAEYDTCAGRFSGIPGDASGALGPNAICPDQMKSCLRRCLH
jgi:hypothetical protein